MSPKSRTQSARFASFAIASAMSVLAAGEASAQASGCGDLQTHLGQRKVIAEKLSTAGKKQIDARVACAGFNQLVQNGNTLLKWATANKDWCQIPDSFMQSIKLDHDKASQIRGKACTVAAKQTEMEKQAKNGGGGQGGGASSLLGGNGLSGATQVPQGAL
ncbi:hypothetical protein [uncultured Enterovirga sp.]|uniref:hypothetical protein n=1 Tax=uncultured Enterovirga sp. TaxID=2026352 RepID=UPI0035CC5B24